MCWHDRGFGMIELLVSLLVLTIGLIGLAALQTHSLQRYQLSYQKSVANSQIQEIAERMRANQAGMAEGAYDVSEMPSSRPTCNKCTPNQIAQRDMYEWNEANKTLLPLGHGMVTSTGKLYTFTIFWEARRTGPIEKNCDSNSATQLTCLTMSSQL